MRIIRYKQQGLALFSSMMFLILLALVGFSVMKISMLSIQIAHNDEMSMKAFNQAELSLRKGEQEVNNLATSKLYTDFNDENDHYYVSPLNKNAIRWVDLKSAGNDQDGRYVIEYLGLRPLETESASIKPNGGISGSNIYISRVISRDREGTTGAKRIIRSSFATINQP